MSRKIAKTLLPHDVEQYVFDTYIGSLYSYKVKQIYTWCNALNIKPDKVLIDGFPLQIDIINEGIIKGK